MAIDSNATTLQYTGNGTTRTFAWDWQIFYPEDLTVAKVDSTGAITILTKDVDYTLPADYTDPDGGNITYPVDATAAALPSTEKLRLVNNCQQTVVQQFLQASRYSPTAVSTALDRACRQLQSLSDRVLKLPLADTTSGALPAKTSRANKVIGFDSSGDLTATAFIDSMTSLTRALVGSTLWPQTAAELAGGVTPTNYYYEPGDVRRYGADPTGVTDCSSAVASAAKTHRIHFGGDGATTYLITAGVTITSACLIDADANVTLKLNIANSGGKAFYVTSNDVHLWNLYVSGNGVTGTLTGTVYAVVLGDGGTKYQRMSVSNLRVVDADRSDGLTQTSNLLVSHALYVQNVDNFSVRGLRVDNVSGAGLFMKDCDQFDCHDMQLLDTQWYAINCDHGCTNGHIYDFEIDCQLATGMYYGGALNLMSLQTFDRNADLLIEQFTMRGKYSYGTPIRILSSDNITVRNFKIEDWEVGTWAADAHLSGVRIDTRGTSTSSQNGPCQNVRIYDFQIDCPTSAGKHRGVYCTNQWQTARTPAYDIHVSNGKITSTDATYHFVEGVVFHGNDGGFENVSVHRMRVSTYAETGPVVAGAIGFVGNSANGGVRDVHIGGNHCTDLGTPSGSHQVGISVGAYTDRVYNDSPNRIDNYFYGVRTLTNSGPTLMDLDDQDWGTNSTNLVDNVTLGRYKRALSSSVAWDPGAIAIGGSETKQLTGVTGAALGDFVQASLGVDLQDLGISAYVQASGVVEVVLQNNTAGAVNLGATTCYVRVKRKGTVE